MSITATRPRGASLRGDQIPCATTLFGPEVWDNKDGPGGAGNTIRGLTRSSDFTREGLAMQATQVCSIEGCTRDARKRGMCHTCYVRLLNRGEIEPLNRSLADRLAAGLVLQPSGCLEWTKGTDTHGYGSIGIATKKTDRTHRVAWTLANGPIPDGLHVLHHCDNPPCCQTDPTEGYPAGHLFLGTNDDNIADKMAKGRGKAPKTHCPADHAYTEANTYVKPNGDRLCRECRRIQALAACKKTPTQGELL